jgi:hypothetical protein
MKACFSAVAFFAANQLHPIYWDFKMHFVENKYKKNMKKPKGSISR